MIGKVLTFYLGSSLCGIDITLAKEINRNIKYTSVPGGAAHVVGLLNVRGQVVTLFDLTEVLHFVEKKDRISSRCIILKRASRGEQIGFLIDKLGEVVDVTSVMCELPPANIRNVEGNFISEVVKLDTQVMLLLDIEKIIDVI